MYSHMLHADCAYVFSSILILRISRLWPTWEPIIQNRHWWPLLPPSLFHKSSVQWRRVVVVKRIKRASNEKCLWIMSVPVHTSTHQYVLVCNRITGTSHFLKFDIIISYPLHRAVHSSGTPDHLAHVSIYEYILRYTPYIPSYTMRPYNSKCNSRKSYISVYTSMYGDIHIRRYTFC